MIRERLFAVIATIGLASSAIAHDDGLKIYISADMEGVVGAVTGEQLSPGGFEYERFRQFMTDEVNAAIDAARAAGADEFLVQGDDPPTTLLAAIHRARSSEEAPDQDDADQDDAPHQDDGAAAP